MDSPTLATIQALVALSAHEAANARDSRGKFIFMSGIFAPPCRLTDLIYVGWLYNGSFYKSSRGSNQLNNY